MEALILKLVFTLFVVVIAVKIISIYYKESKK